MYLPRSARRLMSFVSARRLASFVPVLLAFSASVAHAVPPGNGKLQIVHLNAAQGDAAVLISPNGQVALFDDGANTTFCTNCPSCAEVRSELLSLGVTHADIHFATHYHADHIGCIANLSGITIDRGWDRGQSYSSGAFTNYVNYLGAKRRTLTKGQVFTLDSLSAHPVTITCVALAGDGVSGASSDENALSAVFKVTYGEFDEVIGGDLTGSSPDVETKVGPQVGKVEVYKVHHHGSAYSSNNNWLNATQPKIGVIGVGNGNSYGHPTATALNNLHNHGTRTYWSQRGAGAAPNPSYDKVANSMIRIVATWQPGGVDSIYATAIADSFTNSGSDGVAPSVAVLAPNGGETVPAGTPRSVTWSASDNVGVISVDLAYTLDGGTIWNPIAAGVANSGSYSWNVPNSPSTMTRVRVTARDGAGNTGMATSASNFTIADQTAPSVAATSPNGGESWLAGSVQPVTWNATDNVGVESIDVDYSLHGASGPWLAVQHGLANSGSYSWTVPSSASDSALVRITAADQALNQAVDLSDNLFQMTSPAVDVAATGIFRFALAPPRPTPAHGQVWLGFSLRAPGSARIEVLNVAGARVWGVEPSALGAGPHEISWSGRDDRGNLVASGLYFVRLASGGMRTTTRFVFVR